MGSWLSGLGSALLDVWYFEVSLVALLTFWLLDWAEGLSSGPQ